MRQTRCPRGLTSARHPCVLPATNNQDQHGRTMTIAEALPRGRAIAGRGLAAGAVGKILEWYDFAAYGYFAAVFAKNFFPTGDRFSSILSAYGVFAIAFMMRPLGSILFVRMATRCCWGPPDRSPSTRRFTRTTTLRRSEI